MKLALFDCDGTLADSQVAIVRAMDEAFKALDLQSPGRSRTLAIVGLSLPEAMRALAPDAAPAMHVKLADQYRAAAQRQRLAHADEPLFEGADAAVRRLARRDDIVLGMATGKSRRGVDRLIAHHGWAGYFATLQTADDNPSKPHPGMIEAALAETGVERANAIMIGDTTFDMAMAQAAQVRAIGVAWGYHPPADLAKAGAERVVRSFDELLAALEAA